MQLRKATVDDWQFLLEWRNDADTRRNSVNMDVVAEDGHKTWLAKSVVNPDRDLYVAEVNGVPVGTVRVDRSIGDDSGTVSELSWTIAPASRSNGFGKQMARLALGTVQSGSVVAKIKDFNTPSKKIAEAIGLMFVSAENGMETWAAEVAQHDPE